MNAPNRFYKEVSVDSVPGGFGLALDGKAVRTPARRPLVTPDRSLTEALAEEWRAQTTKIDPHSMPLNRLVNTAIDRVADTRTAVIDQLMEYAGSDLLCYRASGPDDLVERHRDSWDPVLDWMARRFGAHLSVTVGIMPFVQSAEALAPIRARVETFDVLTLAGLADIAALFGSVILGLAVAEGRLTAESAFDLAQLDDLWQEERWGQDYEADIRRQGLKKDALASGRLLEFCRKFQR